MSAAESPEAAPRGDLTPYYFRERDFVGIRLADVLPDRPRARGQASHIPEPGLPTPRLVAGRLFVVAARQ